MDKPVYIRRSFLNGMAYIAAFLAVMGLLAVAAFHYPEYLTTPALREIYSEAQVRTLLFTGLVLGTVLALMRLFVSEFITEDPKAKSVQWELDYLNVELQGVAR